MAKASICEKSYSVEERTASFVFAADAGQLDINLADVKNVLTNLALHGLMQKVGDCFAGEKDPKEAFNKAKELIDRLKAGEWRAARESKGPSTALTVEAIARLRKQDVKDVQAKWEQMDDETRKRVRSDPRVKAEVARIKAERLDAEAAKAEGTDEALAAFG